MGGLVYNTYRGVAVVKAKHAPAQPRTQLQLAVRAIAVTLSRAWAACTHRADWDYYASQHPYTDGMGLSTRATGANWFIALNSRLKAAGETLITEPPSDPAPIAVTGLAVTGSAGQLSVAWTDPASATDVIELWLDGPRSAGRESSIAKIKLHSNHVGNTSPGVLTDLQPGTYTVWARSFSSDTGLVSPWTIDTAVVS